MSNLVKAFEHHFRMKQRGQLPYQKGFVVVGKLPIDKAKPAGPSLQNKALASISPAIAQVERVTERIGGTQKPRTQRSTPSTSSQAKQTRKRPAGKKTSSSSKRPHKEAI